MDQLKSVELLNGRAAMLGLLIGVIVEGLTGFGIAHQIGLGALCGWLYRLPHSILAVLFLNLKQKHIQPLGPA